MTPVNPESDSSNPLLITHVLFFDRLPSEIIKHIFSYFNNPCSLSLVNRSFKELTKLWRFWEIERIQQVPLVNVVFSSSDVHTHQLAIKHLHTIAGRLYCDRFPYGIMSAFERYKWECGISNELIRGIRSEYPYHSRKSTVNFLKMIGLSLDIDLPHSFYCPSGFGVTKTDIEQILKMIKGTQRSTSLTKLNVIAESIYFIPTIIKEFPSLQNLNCGYNLLFQIPSEIGILSNLKKLNLEYNRLSSLPIELRNLSQLKKLNLGDNHFRKIPSCIFELTALQKLLLHRNGLSKLSKKVKNLTNLVTLNFNRNYLKSIPNEISHLQKLQKLFLIDNQLESLPDNFCFLAELHTLDLASNKLTELPCDLEQIPHLQRLDISFNKIKYISYALQTKPNLIIYHSR